MYNLGPLLNDDDTRRSLVGQIEHGDTATYLRSLKLKIISNCNLKCEMCKYWRITKKQLSKEVIFQVLEHAAALGCIKVHLSGGEVTLHHDLTAAIRHGSELGIRMNLTSNGVLMDKVRAREWIDAGLRAACFSLDGMNAKTHDKIRGVKGAYKRTLRAIRIVRREVERTDAKLRVRINMVLSSRNLTEVPGLIRMAGEMGVVDVLPMPIDGMGDLVPTVQQIQEFNRDIVPQMFELRRKYNMPTDAGRLYPFGRTQQELEYASQAKYGFGHYENNLCYAPYLHAFISHTGHVFACCMTREKMKSLGNVCEQTLTDIFQGPLYQKFRQVMNHKRLAVCANCDQYLRENRLVDTRLAEAIDPRLSLPVLESVT